MRSSTLFPRLENVAELNKERSRTAVMWLIKAIAIPFNRETMRVHNLIWYLAVRSCWMAVSLSIEQNLHMCLSFFTYNKMEHRSHICHICLLVLIRVLAFKTMVIPQPSLLLSETNDIFHFVGMCSCWHQLIDKFPYLRYIRLQYVIISSIFDIENGSC